MTAFRIYTTAHSDSCELALVGEVDLDVVPEIIELGTAALADPSTVTLTLNLGDVSFIDSTGLGALVRLHNDALTLGKHLRLIELPERVRKLLRLTGLEALFADSGASGLTA